MQHGFSETQQGAAIRSEGVISVTDCVFAGHHAVTVSLLAHGTMLVTAAFSGDLPMYLHRRTFVGETQRSRGRPPFGLAQRARRTSPTTTFFTDVMKM